MAIEIQGVNNLISKLNKISNIEAKEIIEEVAKYVEIAIVNEAKKFSDTEYLYIGKCDLRNYGSSCLIDVGLKSDTVDFEKWKGLWYHNWGYTHWKSGKMVTPHVMWFDSVVDLAQKEVKSKIKRELKKTIN